MKKMFWIDLEMTGLDEKTDHILEAAVVITDLELKPLEEYHAIVYQPQNIVDGMNDWCKKTHGKSGLTALIPTGKKLELVEKEILELALRHFEKKEEKIVLCGNSVGNDKRFLDQYMPLLAKRLHYRLVDVSSFKEVYRSKYGIEMKKAEGHRAVDDIHESIKELAHYLSFVKIDSK